MSLSYFLAKYLPFKNSTRPSIRPSSPAISFPLHLLLLLHYHTPTLPYMHIPYILYFSFHRPHSSFLFPSFLLPTPPSPIPHTPPTHPPTISLPLTHSSTNQGTGKERRRFAIHSQSNEKRARSGVIRRRLTVSGTRSFFFSIYLFIILWNVIM